MSRIQKIAPITSLQPPYSLVNRKVEAEILPFCQSHNIGVINYSPMQSGLLTGAMTAERIAQMPEDDWRRRSDEFQEPRLSRNLKLVELLREIGQRQESDRVKWQLPGRSTTLLSLERLSEDATVSRLREL